MRTIARAISLGLLLCSGSSAWAQAAPVLPAPGADPLNIDLSSDPILKLSREHASFERFRSAVAAAVERHPGTAEYLATTDVAEAAVREARDRQLPSADLTISTYRVLSREFSNDPGNIIERSRSDRRTDALLSVQQTLFDFGAGEARVAAAGARLRSAAADLEYAADRVALSAVAAWYDVFGYLALVSLTEAFVQNQRELQAAVEERVASGLSAEADVSRVQSYISSAETRLARFRRLLANAQARYSQLTGLPAPETLDRAPAPITPAMTRDAAALAAATTPAVRSAEAIADAARKETKVARAEEMGVVSANVDAGRYGVIETARDYDVRAGVAYRRRLFGGIDKRTDQAAARARAATARADRVREEASRDAAIAWSDIQALEQQLAALEASYIAARRSRDAIGERFRVARGSLFDIVAAEDAYFEAATSYIQTLTELDASRYVLLSRTGRLLTALVIHPGEIGDGH